MDIREILKRYWGYNNFRPLQEEIIHSVLDKKDTLALMPTGGGKSLTYQIPALAMEGVCIVITPLIALMKDQAEELQNRDIAAAAIYTGMEAYRIESVIQKTIGGKIKFLYISPERLASGRFRELLKQMPVCMLAVDEAHCISQWGYDFRPSYLRIAEVRSFFPEAPVLALTATATPEVVKDIQKQLKFAVPHVLSKSFRRDNISYIVRKANDKLGELHHILSKLQSSAIVYARKRATTEDLAKFLSEKGITADYYHAGLPAMQRASRQEEWKKGNIPVIVATNAFGMGIDKADVRVVIHFDIPDSPEAYFQEAGRAGRDGKRAYAVLLYNEATLTALKKRISLGFPEKRYICSIYDALGNFFHLGEGEGGGFAFEFDPEIFVKTFKLEYISALAAIDILQVAGYLECTTAVHARSRIIFTVIRDQLYKIDLDSNFLERLIEYILRHYPGVFAQYAYIDEEQVAGHLGVKRETVYESLLLLAKRKIISYVPGNDRLYIVYHQPRVPSSYLHFSKEAYEQRKHSYAIKIAKMAGYIETDDCCRQLYLMEYFGQKEKHPCGVCDYCLNAKKKQPKQTYKKEIDGRIIQLLQHSDMEIRDLLHELDDDRDFLITRIRSLLEEGKLYYKTPLLLSLKQ